MIEKKRVEKGLTQQQVAKYVGVSRSTVTKWELGISFPRKVQLLKLSDLFGCTLDELVRGGEKDGREESERMGT